MIAKESIRISSVTHKLKSYLKDLDAAFVVFEAQKLQLNAKTEDERKKQE